MATGQFNFEKFTTFLKSFWGLLASFTVILPTIIYFINTTQIKESEIHEYYIGVPTTFALLTIPFIFLFEDKLSNLNIARKQSLILAILGLVFILSFIVTKNFFISDKEYSFNSDNNYKRTDVKESRQGVILLVTYASPNFDKYEKRELRTNFYEILAVIFYSFSIILLTASFATLGVFFYTKT